MLSEPETADDPRIAGDGRSFAGHALIGVILVSSDAAHLGLHPKLFADGVHGAFDHRSGCAEHAEVERREGRRIDGAVELQRLVPQNQAAGEARFTLQPEMANHRIADLDRHAEIVRAALLLVEQIGQIGRRVERGAYRGAGEGEHTLPLFPHVKGGQRQPGGRIAKSDHELRGLDNQPPVDGANEVEIAGSLVMPPQEPQHQRRFILLDGQLLLAVAHPRVP